MTPRLRAVAVLALVLAGCPSSSGEFSIIPSASAAIPDQVIKLALSQSVPGVSWSATGGTVTSSGLFTAPGCSAALPQTITVTATSGILTATATVTVSDTVTGVSVTPPSASVPPGGTVQFTATVRSVCNPAGVTSSLRVSAPAATTIKK